MKPLAFALLLALTSPAAAQDVTGQATVIDGAGMFAGSYIEPWAYRACIRSGGRPLPCSDGD